MFEYSLLWMIVIAFIAGAFFRAKITVCVTHADNNKQPSAQSDSEIKQIKTRVRALTEKADAETARKYFD